MAPNTATYFTYSALTDGTRATLEDLHTELRKYSRDSVVYVCSLLNHLLRTWAGGDFDLSVHDDLLKTMFSQHFASLLMKASRSQTEPKFVFHRQQLLIVAREAMCVCPDRGMDFLERKYWGGLGVAFLMASDLTSSLSKDAQDPVDKTYELLADVISAIESSGWHFQHTRIVRTYLMTTKCVEENRNHPSFVDIHGLFKERVGISIQEFQAVCFLVLAKYMNIGYEDIKAHQELFYLPRSYFAKTKLTDGHISAFLEHSACTAEMVTEKTTSGAQSVRDVTIFRDRPIYKSGDNFHIIDTAFMEEKLETAPFWVAMNALSKDVDKNRLHNYWGALFETYMNTILQTACASGPNDFVPSPMYEESGDQVCDGIIISGSDLVLMEYKSSTFTAKSKYGGDRDTLKNELRKKLVAKGKVPKGVSQLSTALHRLYGLGNVERIIGMDSAKVRRVFSVLVTRDDIAETILLNYLLNQEFQGMIRKKDFKPRVITPLHCMSAGAMEFVVGHLSITPFPSILDARYRADRNLSSTFLATDNPLLDANEGNTSSHMKDYLDEFLNMLAEEYLFDPSEVSG